MEKLSASFLAALSASLLYLVLRRRAKPSIALLLTLAYAFGTTTWVISSQALWQHGVDAAITQSIYFDSSAVSDVSSAGFRTTVLPAASWTATEGWVPKATPPVWLVGSSNSQGTTGWTASSP